MNVFSLQGEGGVCLGSQPFSDWVRFLFLSLHLIPCVILCVGRGLLVSVVWFVGR